MILLRQEANLQTSLDAFKVQLGLPPELEVRLDDTILQQFQLNDPRLDTMRTENDARHLRLLQPDETAPAELTAAARQLQKGYDELEEQQVQAQEGAAPVADPARGRAEAGLLRPRRGPGQGLLRAEGGPRPQDRGRPRRVGRARSRTTATS